MALSLSTALVNRLTGETSSYNLITTNSTFATDLTGWASTYATQASTITGARGTTGYAVLTATTSTAAQAQKTGSFSLTAKMTYGLTFWCYKPATSGTGITVKIGTTQGGAELFTATYTPATTGVWEKVKYAFRIPSTQATSYITFLTSTATTGDVVYFDEILLQPEASCLQDIFEGGFLKIYDGTAPITADAAIGSSGTNNLLVTIYSDGTAAGLNLENSGGGVISKPNQTGWQNWSGTALLTGTASFFRFVAIGDTGASAATLNEPRIQGNIATSGANLNMTTTSITQTAVQTINLFSIIQPIS